jgi:hypothetical protein
MGQEEELIDNDRLSRTRFFPNGTFARGDSIYDNTKNLKDSNEIAKYMKENLVEGEYCGMFGIIQLERSNGNIHFSTHKRH